MTIPTTLHQDRRRKLTDGSCELALIECASKSDSEDCGYNSSMALLVNGVRRCLLEYTEPEWFRGREEQRMMQAMVSMSPRMMPAVIPEESEFMEQNENSTVVMKDEVMQYSRTPETGKKEVKRKKGLSLSINVS